ncbi:catalase family protein [Sphingomonas sp. ac-8]|uniref:catalase family protein n=1 Tax=Sphingomonas sp. ac-8 TaxID=3242977 RepID=UPI003A805C2B
MAPVRYTPSVEQPQPDEAETIAGLEEQFGKILDTTSQDYGHAVRSVHAKGHGLARGTLTVASGLPDELAQGLFATPGEHEAILRFSTNAGDLLDDSVRLPRGVALKVLGVEGERLPGSESDTTQDFVLVNAPAFSAPDAKKFLANLKLLAVTTDKAEGGKKLLSGVLRTVESALEAVGAESATLSTLGGAKPFHPLGATYYSQTPFRYGAYIAKFQLVPVSAIKGFADETINASGRPDAIREAMNALLLEQGGTWELRVQLCTDIDTMPIEDASVEWDEAASPYRTVATL